MLNIKPKLSKDKRDIICDSLDCRQVYSYVFRSKRSTLRML
jgi:hypothetical protein